MSRNLSPEAAQYWLSVKRPVSDQDRVDELSSRARDASLSESESRDLDHYLNVGFLARKHARQGTPSAAGRGEAHATVNAELVVE